MPGGAEMAAACRCDILMGTVYSTPFMPIAVPMVAVYALRRANFTAVLYPARYPGGDDLRGRGAI